jgi:uncharacterized protein involved in exopolysaccharide biosynthesis
MQFDPRVETVTDIQPSYNAYPTLAMGDELISILLEDLGDEIDPPQQSVSTMRGMLKASKSGDPSIVTLTATDHDPARAALIANRWAALFVQAANDLYGQSTEELAFFELQLSEAETALSKSEQDLIDFQRDNDATVLEAQLESQESLLDGYLDTARTFVLVIEDAKTLQDRLHTQDPSTPALLSDEVSMLLLQVSALRASLRKTSQFLIEEEDLIVQQSSDAAVLPIQVQITGQERLDDRTMGEQIAFLDSLIDVLEDKLVVLQQKSQALEPDILALQQALQQAQTDQARLERSQEIAQETYMTLSRKAAEIRIAAQDETGDVRLAGHATVPDKPVAPRKLLNTVLAGASGLLLGVFAAFAVEYWRTGAPAPPGQEKQDNS